MDRKAAIELKRWQIPKRCRGIYDKAVKGKSLRAAVDAQCLDCCGYSRNEVSVCTAAECPLWAVRPYQDFSIRGREGLETEKTEANEDQLVLNH